MQRLEVSCEVRLIYTSLGAKWLTGRKLNDVQYMTYGISNESTCNSKETAIQSYANPY